MDTTLPAALVVGKPRAQHLRVIFALVVREMAARFDRSDGGYIWAILEPLGGILLLSIVFSVALRTPPLGTSFILFYASGNIPFRLYKTMSEKVSAAVTSNRGLLNYPVVTLLDAVFAKFLLNLLTMLVVAVILFTGIILILDLKVDLDLGAIFLGLLLAGLLGLGTGTLNCVLFGLYPVWKSIWKMVTRPLMFLSAVLHLYEIVPPGLQAIFWWNPLVHVMGIMRAGFYSTYHPQYISYSYVLAVALGTFVIGAYLMRRHASLLLDQ